MQTTSTQTHVDRMKASKELAEGNAVKIQEKHTLEREILELTAAKAQIVRVSGYTPEEYEKVEKEHMRKMESIEIRVTNLNSDVETAENRLKQAIDGQTVVARAVDDLERQKTSLEGLVGRLTQSLSDLEGNMRSASEAFRVASLKQQNELVEENKVLDRVKGESKSIARDLDQRTAAVVEQERSSAIRRTDLEIYEARLRKKYPNEAFI